MNGILITGTDTGVGKTYTALGIIARAKKNGIKVAAMKPWETGCRRSGNQLIPADAMRLMKAAGMNDIDTVNPCRFKTPVAPYVAARREGRSVQPGTINKVYHRLALHYDFVIVEGAGGLLVPITRTYFYADLAREFSLSVLVVAANKLGVINHILLTVDYIEAHGLKLTGVVLNNTSPKNTIAKKTNAHTLSLLLGRKFIGELAFNHPGKNEQVYEKILNLSAHTPVSAVLNR